MTGQRVRYATPSLTFSMPDWFVLAQPWNQLVGRLEAHASGWTAIDTNGRYAGLWPTKQAAAEVLVKQAGYELETT